MRKKIIPYRLSCILLFLFPIIGHTETLKIGNFALPESQQPGPFYSFGQNIIGKGEKQFYIMPGYLEITNGYSLSTTPECIYGFTDDFSVLVDTVISLNQRHGNATSNGLSDTLFQFEYAFYNKEQNYYSDTATVLAGLQLPTGSFKKDPPTGSGVTSLFLGATYNRTWYEWMFFTSTGSFIPLNRQTQNSGAQYLLQFGLGKNILSQTDKYILLGLCEIDAEHADRGVIRNAVNLNSNGNLVNLVPSLYFATEQLILQFGVALPIYQQWNGNQPNYNYFFSLFLGWTIP